MKKDDKELITQSEAADMRSMTLAAVNEHVRSGRWRSAVRYGKRLVYREDVVGFEPKTHKAKHRPGKRKASKK
jgi:hypothetical protein